MQTNLTRSIHSHVDRDGHCGWRQPRLAKLGPFDETDHCLGQVGKQFVMVAFWTVGEAIQIEMRDRPWSIIGVRQCERWARDRVGDTENACAALHKRRLAGSDRAAQKHHITGTYCQHDCLRQRSKIPINWDHKGCRQGAQQPQPPPQHPPPPAMLGAAAIAGTPPLTRTRWNVDNNFSTVVPPQSGHTTTVEPDIETSSSN